jgi:hypothetical protein
MIDTKLWYQSKTVWGALIAIAASLLQATGVDFDLAGQDQLAENLVALSGAIGAIGGLVALYGRMSADKRLG